jgi:hypothetical protein
MIVVIAVDVETVLSAKVAGVTVVGDAAMVVVDGMHGP